MFEAEIEYEKKTNSFLPAVLMVSMILVVVGAVGGVLYTVLQAKKEISASEASSATEAVLKSQSRAVVRFHAGMVKSSVSEKPLDPHYKLLEKAGVVRLAKGSDASSRQVTLTAAGEKLLTEIGAQRTQDSDGTVSFVAPLAERKLVQVNQAAMSGPNHARVDYTWRWQPNPLGNFFDASGSLVKGFNTWDRGTLIQKYGVAFYQAEPAKASVALLHTDKGWILAPAE